MKALSSQFRIHVPDILFYELDTTDDPQVRERCYRSLDECDGALERIVSVGDLLRFEQREAEPCTPISAKGLVALLSRELLQRHQRTANARPPAEYLTALPYLLGAFDVVEEFFPPLKGMKVGDQSRRDELERIKREVAQNSELIRAIYGQIRQTVDDDPSRLLPTPALIDQRWAFFRWLQVQLLAAIKYRWRYGKSAQPRETFHNSACDAEYCVIATLLGGLASRDLDLKNDFGLLCPEGTLVN